MKKYLILIVFLLLTILNINSSENKKQIFHNFSGGLATHSLVPFVKYHSDSDSDYDYDYDSDYDYDDYSYRRRHTLMLPVALYLGITLKFDYLFLKTVNSNYYKIGFGLSLGESINVSGMALISPSYPYQIINRLQQKITLANMFGNDERGWYTLLEIGLTFSLINIINLSFTYYDNCTTFYTGPYLFVGFTGISKKEYSKTSIIGGFTELIFDVGKYMLKYDNPVVKNIAFALSFGVEYRIGHAIKQ